MSYVERLVASPLICCTWEQRTDAAYEQLVVPDACVDLIWSGERVTIAGPDTRARRVEVAPGTRLVGVRLRPGAAGAALGLPAAELCDAAPSAAEVLGRAATEHLAGVRGGVAQLARRQAKHRAGGAGAQADADEPCARLERHEAGARVRPCDRQSLIRPDQVDAGVRHYSLLRRNRRDLLPRAGRQR